MKTRLAVVSVIALVMVASASCSSGDPVTNPSYTPMPVPISSGASIDTDTTLHLITSNGIITDGNSRPVYASTADAPEQSNCTTDCPGTFEPVHERDDVQALPPLDNNLVETTGAGQVMYNGHPLYYCVQDAGSTTANCNGQGGTWFLLDNGGNLSK